MTHSKWMLVAPLMLSVLFLAGCGGPHLYEVRVPLRVGDIDYSTSLIVTPIRTDGLTFSGDAAGDAEKTDEARRRIERELARLISDELRDADFDAATGEGGKDDVLIQVEVQHFDYGSAVARGLIGRGSGQSSMLIRVRITRGRGGETIADFDIRPSSGGSGGWWRSRCCTCNGSATKSSASALCLRPASSAN